MTVEKKEILFIYNSAMQDDRVALGYTKALKDFVIKEFDIKKEAFTETQLKEIATRLLVKPADLIDRESDIYVDKYAGSQLKETDVLVALKHEPDLMRTPIAIYHERAEFVHSKYDFISRGMQSPTIKSSKANEGEKES